MPTLFSAPKVAAPPPIAAPIAMPVPAGPNNSAPSAAIAQTIAQSQAASGRTSTDLVKGQATTLG